MKSMRVLDISGGEICLRRKITRSYSGKVKKMLLVLKNSKGRPRMRAGPLLGVKSVFEKMEGDLAWKRRRGGAGH